MPDPVTLTKAEMLAAGTVALQRVIESSIRGHQHRAGMSRRDEWRNHIEGAFGELAVAKFLGVYFDASVGTFKKGGDVAGLEVRTTGNPDLGLIVRPEDPDDRTYVLVVGQAPTYSVVGCIKGIDAKRPEWIRDHAGRAPAYFVPRYALKPLKPGGGK